MKLSPAHFAYLRSIVEGLGREDSARRYLGMDHGHQAKRLHDQAVAHLRAVARRAGDSRWRLVGMETGAPESPEPSSTKAPTLQQWVAARGYEDWSEAEQLELYADAFPQANGSAAATSTRKLQRSARLRRRQLAVLADLEKAAAVQPQPTDPVDAWFDPTTAARLQRAGFVMIGEVLRAGRAGGRWWSGMPGVGVTKAARMLAFLERLLPATAAAPTRALAPAGALASVEGDALAHRSMPRLGPELDGSAGSNRASRRPTIDASTDLQAIQVWVTARAKSKLTAATYEREALRWMLWCAMERSKPLSSAGPDDCLAYMQFLQRIPVHWIHRGRRERLGQGWTPFRGPLGLAARRLAVKVLHLMCSWLVDHARYLDANPWAAVNRGLVDGQDQPEAPTSRALTPEAYSVLLEHAKAEVRRGTLPAAGRNLFILVWTRHTGLRAAELLNAQLGDLRRTRAGWLLGVVGKGNKRREVSVPAPAIAALKASLEQRGLPPLDQCTSSTSLVVTASAATPAADGEPAKYAAVHESFRRFVRRAVRASTLRDDERARVSQATQHWLRHTYATRFAEVGGAQDVLMAELGHADPGTTARYYTAQAERRQAEVERVAQLNK